MIGIINLTLIAILAYHGTLLNVNICTLIFSPISRLKQDNASIFFNVFIDVPKVNCAKFYARNQQTSKFRWSFCRIFSFCMSAILKFSACTKNFSRSRSLIHTIFGNLLYPYDQQLLTNFQIKTLQFQNFYTSACLDLHAPSFSQIFEV